MIKQDVWALIQDNKFELACEVAEGQFIENNATYLLRNKLFALLNLRKYQEAYNLAEKLRGLEHNKVSDDFVLGGIAIWLQGNHDAAITLWEAAIKEATYFDEAGGLNILLILYFSSVMKNDENGKREIKKRIKKKVKNYNLGVWSKPLGLYVLGVITDEELVTSVTNVAVLRERQLCWLFFIQAIVAFENGRIEKYKELLVDCVGLKEKAYLEEPYYLANYLLEKSDIGK